MKKLLVIVLAFMKKLLLIVLALIISFFVAKLMQKTWAPGPNFGTAFIGLFSLFIFAYYIYKKK